jgi:hypothetical protein
MKLRDGDAIAELSFACNDGGNISHTKTPKKRSTRGSLAEAFKKLIEDKWFKGGKTTGELRLKLREMAVHVPVTQLPRHLINAYHAGKLTRSYETREGKEVLVYSQE